MPRYFFKLKEIPQVSCVCRQKAIEFIQPLLIPISATPGIQMRKVSVNNSSSILMSLFFKKKKKGEAAEEKHKSSLAVIPDFHGSAWDTSVGRNGCLLQQVLLIRYIDGCWFRLLSVAQLKSLGLHSKELSSAESLVCQL